MNTNDQSIDIIPDDAIYMISNYLKKEDLARFGSTSKRYQGIKKELFDKKKEEFIKEIMDEYNENGKKKRIVEYKYCGRRVTVCHDDDGNMDYQAYLGSSIEIVNPNLYNNTKVAMAHTSGRLDKAFAIAVEATHNRVGYNIKYLVRNARKDGVVVLFCSIGGGGYPCIYNECYIKVSGYDNILSYTGGQFYASLEVMTEKLPGDTKLTVHSGEDVDTVIEYLTSFERNWFQEVPDYVVPAVLGEITLKEVWNLAKWGN
jgi:hypothetical protein